MANFLGAERRFNGQGAVGPFPSGLEIDSYTGQSSQDRSQNASERNVHNEQRDRENLHYR